MNSRTDRISRGLRTMALLLFATAFLSRCARIMTPDGGPRDTLPPVIVNMSPDNFTTNFAERRIYIEFDEFIQIKDQNKEFFTSPQMKKKPTITQRGRGIMIQIKDTLFENQTYALDFGSAIRDNNEGNPLYGMRYVFSTGDTVDSMMCTGYTADAFKSDSVSRTFLYFFYADSLPETPGYDSTLFNRKPDLIARAENNGVFIAQNLKPVDYRVYAVEDTNDNQMYEPGVDKVGFVDSLCNPARMPDFYMWYDSIRHYVTAEPQLYFRMFTDKSFRRHNLQQTERPSRNKALLYFGAEHPDIRSIRFDSVPAERFIVDPRTRGRDTVALWFAGTQLPDTIRGEITYVKHDSVNNLAEVTEPLKLAWRYIESKEEQREREKLERERAKAEAAGEEWTEPKKKNTFAMRLTQSGEINPLRPLEVSFDYPLERIDSAAIVLNRLDEGGDVERVPVRFERDTADMLRWYMHAAWRPAAKYALTLPEGAFADIAGGHCDSVSNNYTTYDPEKFGRMNVAVTGGRDGVDYIVQLLNGSGKMLEERRGVRGGTVTFEYVPVGEAKIRIVEDVNGNGEWDTGNVVERRQPERSEVYV
ncbi:MAG: Ig-like domain-containing protein, partial [Alistipes sp.]|nr:Ig-like domain-containing protein [Alistipes sp.]